MKTSFKIAVISTGIFALSALPAFAETVDLTVTGNGKDSNNSVTVSQETATVVAQTNNTSVTNLVSAVADTGGNKVSGTTGGDVSVTTGTADTKVKIENTAGSNVGSIDNCACDTLAITAKIADNGAGSANTVKAESESMTALIQTNNTHIFNAVDTQSTTGDNKVTGTTNGDVTVDTGSAATKVKIDNTAGSNTGSIGGGESGGNTLSAMVQQNGADSVNKISAEVEKGIVLGQTNQTGFQNLASGLAGTGDNKAKGTTGGSVTVMTGDASVKIGVKNQAGFNQASVNCDCLITDVSAKIKDNGKDSHTSLKVNLESVLSVKQTNACGKTKGLLGLLSVKGGDCASNGLFGQALTGSNKLSGGTQGSGDPSVTTGTSSVKIDAVFTGGSNLY